MASLFKFQEGLDDNFHTGLWRGFATLPFVQSTIYPLMLEIQLMNERNVTLDGITICHFVSTIWKWNITFYQFTKMVSLSGLQYT
jgi:hypothetical protein